MSDWRDVMDARSTAGAARNNLSHYSSEIEDGRTGDVSIAVLVAAQAVCTEIRALAVLLDHALHDAIPHQGRP